MNSIKEKILTKIKSIQTRDVIYPTLIFIFLLTIMLLFILSANSLSKIINKSLTDIESPVNPLLINKKDLNIIIHKLNINTQTKTITNEKPATTTATTTANKKKHI